MNSGHRGADDRKATNANTTRLTADDTLEDAHFEGLAEAVPETVEERPVAVSARETEKSESCATLRIYVALTSSWVWPSHGDSTHENAAAAVADGGTTAPQTYPICLFLLLLLTLFIIVVRLCFTRKVKTHLTCVGALTITARKKLAC